MERQELVELISKKVTPLVIGNVENKIITERLNLINKQEEKQCTIPDISGLCGIKVDVNPFNDPRWSKRTGIHEEHKFKTLRAYELSANKITFKKPKQEKCFSVLCFDKILYSVASYKVKNWEELPNKLPYNEDILKSPFFLNKSVKVV